MTNGDRIREMASTNEGLAALIADHIECGDCPIKCGDATCEQSLGEWLEKEYIKPCPFCGDEDIREYNECNQIWLECSMCGGRTMPCISYKIAVMRWNRRAGNAD